MDRRLIIDVGMHDGQDTAFYLAKGFNVVAVEANPDLVAQAHEAFAREIGDGTLRVLEVAIAEGRGAMPLAVADDMTVWSTLAPDWVALNQRSSDTAYRYVEVETVPFAEVLREVGIPYYLKVDIEGYDMLCVRALHDFPERPAYVSIESSVSSLTAPMREIASELEEFRSLGYRRFQYVDQTMHPHRESAKPALEGNYVDARFTTDSSGPFGRELTGRWHRWPAAFAQGQLLGLAHNLGGHGGRWSERAAGRIYGRAHRKIRGRGTPWFDLHAALDVG
jgi:FkbM family methyltransferase